jgi:hypothetical protein
VPLGLKERDQDIPVRREIVNDEDGGQWVRNSGYTLQRDPPMSCSLLYIRD